MPRDLVFLPLVYAIRCRWFGIVFLKEGLRFRIRLDPVLFAGSVSESFLMDVLLNVHSSGEIKKKYICHKPGKKYGNMETGKFCFLNHTSDPGYGFDFKILICRFWNPLRPNNGPDPQPCLNDQTHSFQHVILRIVVAVLDMLEKNNNKICWIQVIEKFAEYGTKKWNRTCNRIFL